jgi:hypothetical protein
MAGAGNMTVLVHWEIFVCISAFGGALSFSDDHLRIFFLRAYSHCQAICLHA